MKSNFDRPIFIVAAPRSCSTLLFQTLAQSVALWSLGDESHHVFEVHSKLRPGAGVVDSNRLDANSLDDELAQAISATFISQLQDNSGHAIGHQRDRKIRLLEKTPKNSLRIPFIDALFPDALFIYLFRDPRDNLNSIIEAWRSGRFVTYPSLQTAHGPWSLLLPPEWRSVIARPLEEIAAFQWLSANRFAIEDLQRIAPERSIAVNADEFLLNPMTVVTKLCQFMGVDLDSSLRSYLESPLPLSRYTLSIPKKNKWRNNERLIERVWPQVVDMIAAINRFAGEQALPISTSVDWSEHGPARMDVPAPGKTLSGNSRNRSCPCGSGKRYKVCHGLLQ